MKSNGQRRCKKKLRNLFKPLNDQGSYNTDYLMILFKFTFKQKAKQ